MTDFRALCAELADELQEYINYAPVCPCDEEQTLVDRARAALAQPEPQGPTDLQNKKDAELSPQAQAVLDAYMVNCGWLDGPLQKDYQCAATVLRAVVQELKYFGVTEKNILAIAAELEEGGAKATRKKIEMLLGADEFGPETLEALDTIRRALKPLSSNK